MRNSLVLSNLMLPIRVMNNYNTKIAFVIAFASVAAVMMEE